MLNQVQHDGVGLRFTVNLSNCVTLNLVQGLKWYRCCSVPIAIGSYRNKFSMTVGAKVYCKPLKLRHPVRLRRIQGLMQGFRLPELAVNKADHAIHENLFDCRWW